MQIQSLNGRWTVQQTGKKKQLQGKVPGDIYRDLLDAREIPDPFFRENENDLRWIGESAWEYFREFTVTQALLAHDRVLLRCHGLDTFAEVRINGKRLARTDNMFRTWEFDAHRFLIPGRNIIEVTFASVLPHIRKRQKGAIKMRPSIKQEVSGRGWIRKEPCNFGWDWGPVVVTCGIWRDIELVAFNNARLSDVHITQDHRKAPDVKVNVSVISECLSGAPLRARIVVRDGKTIVAEKTVRLKKGKGLAGLVVKKAKLWWPNNLGKQPLYDVTVELLDNRNSVLDSSRKRIGLRTLKLDRHKDQWGESFQFVANGIPFFAKGANWIPADAVLSRLTPADYERLIAASAKANMNMLRVWGGGIYEHDVFYEMCDRYGICVWQDFMFACSTYPAHEKPFMDSVREEARDNVRRIRHHACMALWCGNNELEQMAVGPKWTTHQMPWREYKKLFDKLLPDVIRELDPERDYWPSSAHSPHGDRLDHSNPKWGDAHLWSVWHGQKPFEWYRTCEHRFNSEFGFQSFPEPRTVKSYTLPQDRNVTTHVMEHHQRSGIGNTTIMRYMLDWYRLPANFDMTLWLSQILHGMAMKYAVEHWRRSMPRGMGTLYWQLNDCWPVASWASIDNFGRYKALQYMARHFFAPALVSGIEDIEKGTVEVHVTSDLLAAADARVTWNVTTVDGRSVTRGSRNIRMGARRDRRVTTLRLQAEIQEYGARNLLVWLELNAKGQPASTNLVTFAKPKHLELARPAFSTQVRKNADSSFSVRVKADKPALWTWLEVDGKDASYSDNFFHLPKGKTVTVRIRSNTSPTLGEMKKRLHISSLVDTYKA